MKAKDIYAEKFKEKIGTLRLNIRDLEMEIVDAVNRAMSCAGVRIPSQDPVTREIIPGMFDDAQWFHISDTWDCPESPFGYCMYHKILDRSHDNCVFCHEPHERK